MAEYERRLSPRGSNPEAIGNLYYGTMLLLCAVREASDRLGAYDYGLDIMGTSGDAVSELVGELLESPVLSGEDLLTCSPPAHLLTCARCSPAHLFNCTLYAWELESC